MFPFDSLGGVSRWGGGGVIVVVVSSLVSVGGTVSAERRPIRSRCSKRWREDHSRKAWQREREVGLSVSTHGMFRMICQLYYKLFPQFVGFFVSLFVIFKSVKSL